MLIDGIDHRVLFLFCDDKGNWFREEAFNDFYEMNEFIRANPEYADSKIDFTLVEIWDEHTHAAIGWTKPFVYIEYSEEDMRNEIEDYRESLIEFEKMRAEVDKARHELEYRGEAENYEKKKSRLKDFVYVCPHCIRELEECRCKTYPYYLMQIDREMLPIVQELNWNGYKTKFCCAGHLDNPEEFKSSGMYVTFDKDYDFHQPVPEGFYYSKQSHGLYWKPREEEYDNLEQAQLNAIWALSDWAEMLFEEGFWDRDDDYYFDDDEEDYEEE